MSTHRQQFFDRQVHMQSWKNSMSGDNEKPVIQFFQLWGYELGKDYVRQYPIGDRFVMDFAFIKERICVEVDGKSHQTKRQRALDHKRDKFMYRNGWVIIRIPEERFFGRSGSFYKYLINEVVEARRKQYESGFLYPIDIKAYKDGDY